MSDRTIKTCSIPDCGKPHEARGWCKKHYKRWERNGHPLAGKASPNPGQKCSVDQCSKAIVARGYCGKHYQTWSKYGDPIHRHVFGKELPCSIDECENNQYGHGYCLKHWARWRQHGDPLKLIHVRASSSEESFALRTEWQGDCLVWTGTKLHSGYGRMSHNKKRVMAHRYAWERVNGPIPDGMLLDHTCWNKSCVNVDHLRLATKGENNSYRNAAQANSTSGVRNVHAYQNQWRVVLQKNGKRIHYGLFSTIEESAVVAEQARQELFGEFAGRG